jgi:signal transduction histidine kinase/signal recognition particle receptor subunit beta
MSVVNLRDKTIHAKVVYYGPPLGGKTTSLQHVHRVMDPERRTNLISLNTDQDRTLFFDFLPMNLGRIGDFTLRIQAFTVPGQVKYLLTRRYVLRGADAVVFVADSRTSERKSNVASLRDLKANLAANGLPWENVPLVLAYNKRDEAAVMEPDEMDRTLNERRVLRFETVATAGTGVFEAFAAATEAMVERIAGQYRIGAAGEAGRIVRAALGKVHAASVMFRAAGGPAAPAADGSSVVVVDGTGTADPTLTTEQLLEKALDTNMRVAELLTEVQEARSDLQSRVGELTTLYRVSGSAAATLDEDRVVAAVVEGAAAALRTGHASILLRDAEDGSLRERGVHGFLYDPLVGGGGGGPAAGPVLGLLRAGEPVLVTEEGPPGVLAAVRAREPSVRAAVAAPLRVREEDRGLMVVYYTGAGLDPGPSEVRFLGALAAGASVALENARLHGRLERFNRELEAKVAERTRDLEGALRELRQLDQMKEDFLSTMSHELMTPLAGIRSSAEILRSYDDLTPAERADFLSGIGQETDRLTSRLQDILDLSSLDAGRVKFAPGPTNVRDVLQRSLERTRPAFEARRVRVGVWPQASLPRVLGDAKWLGRALDHLLENAAKFSPEGAEADVTVERDGPWVKLSVRDRGPGIPAGERDSVFERFKQAGQVLTDKPPGIGAGLPLARRIVEGNGGEIGIEGGPGRGTVVWIRLRVA